MERTMAQVENLKIGNTSYEINDKKALHQWDTMPTPSSEYTNVIVQYTGADTATFKNGFLYKCQRTRTFPIISTQGIDSVTITNPDALYDAVNPLYNWLFGTDIPVGADNLTFYYRETYIKYWLFSVKVDSTEYEVEYSNEDIPGVVITGSLEDSYSKFTFGFNEQLAWVEVNTQEVINDLDSLSETKALSAYMGNVLAERINNIGTIGRFLAMWDADTGIARYLDVGFEYERGDYFIVASVAGEGGVNYMPDGDTYTEPSEIEAEDDLKISDMYYYDGTRWIYMANHEKQIAVDDYLDATSVNPVQNRVITNKVNNIETVLNGKQDKLISGTNIKTINGNDILGAGDIEIKAGGGSAGVPCIVDVDSKQLGNYAKNRFGDDYLGYFTYMQFTTNLDKEQLVEKMNDLYVTISRRKRQTQRNSGSGNIAKMVVQNDQRFKLDKKLYCWRYTEDGVDEADPRRYYYYYTEERYNDSVADLFEEDPYVYMYTGWDFPSSKATCLNILDQDTNGWTISDAGEIETISRYEDGDLDTFVPKNTRGEPAFDYTTYVTQMHGREATKDGARYFLWCADWSDTTTNAVYGTGVAEDIPEHFEGIEIVTVSEYELGNNRPDLDYYQFNTTESMYDFVEGLYHSTMGTENYPLEEGHYNWSCYPFDYPIIPTRLADCEVLVSMQNAGDGSTDRKGDWIKLKEIKDMPFFANLKQIVFRHPMNTSELWMRFSSWQKRCMYANLNDELGCDAGVKNCWSYAVDANINGRRPNYAFGKRSFARQRGGFRSYQNEKSKITEYIDFNLATGEDISHGLMSKSTPVRKRLVSTAVGARSWLSD